MASDHQRKSKVHGPVSMPEIKESSAESGCGNFCKNNHDSESQSSDGLFEIETYDNCWCDKKNDETSLKELSFHGISREKKLTRGSLKNRILSPFLPEASSLFPKNEFYRTVII